MATFRQQLRNRPAQNITIIVAGEFVKVRDRKPTPRRTQHCEPRYAILAIEERAGQRQRIQHLGAFGKSFEIDRAEGNCLFAERLRNRLERFVRPTQYSNAVSFSASPGFLDSAHVTANERDDLFRLRFVRGLARLSRFQLAPHRVFIARSLAYRLRHEVDVQMEPL